MRRVNLVEPPHSKGEGTTRSPASFMRCLGEECGLEAAPGVSMQSKTNYKTGLDIFNTELSLE